MMNIVNKTLIRSWIIFILILWYSFTFWDFQKESNPPIAQEIWIYEEAEKIAQEFIAKNIDNEYWRREVPVLWEWILMYTEKIAPSYIEYSVLCDAEKECWFILINLDGDDVKVPVFSLSDTSATTILAQKSRTKKENLEFYYFSLFSIYAKNKITGEMYAFHPEIDPTEDMFIWMQQQDINRIMSKQRSKIPEIFQKELAIIKKYKQSQKGKWYSQKNDNSAPYPLPDRDTWQFVPGLPTYDCWSIVPCYKQYAYRYGNFSPCASWCMPVAVAMIFGYHDRQTKPDLVEWIDIAPMRNHPQVSKNIRQMISDLRAYMGTTCKNPNDDGIYAWSTSSNNVWNSLYYATYQWFGASTFWTHIHDSEQGEDTMDVVMTEIDNGRPIIMNIMGNDEAGHAVVGYAYSSDTTTWYWVGVNIGWWPNFRPNIIINIENIAFWWYHTLHSIHTFDIQE